MYEDGDELLMVASDRISAYDVVLPDADPRQGQGADADVDLLVRDDRRHRPQPLHLRGRPRGGRRPGAAGQASSRCTRSSAWSAATSPAPAGRSTASPGRSAGSSCRRGCRSPTQLPEPIFTPATKAEIGEHDENIDFDRAARDRRRPRPLMEELRRVSIELYEHAADHAAERGIILADTKFEFGSSPGAEVVLGDEVLTPDSSRFWPADDYEPGRGQASFDKQYVRDWLDESGWDHSPPGARAARRGDRQDTRPSTSRPTSGSPGAASDGPPPGYPARDGPVRLRACGGRGRRSSTTRCSRTRSCAASTSRCARTPRPIGRRQRRAGERPLRRDARAARGLPARALPGASDRAVQPRRAGRSGGRARARPAGALPRAARAPARRGPRC